MFPVSALHTYPVKSCAGLSHKRIAVEPRGLRGDRRWLVTDANDRFITGRQCPALVTVRVDPRDGYIALSAPGRDTLTVRTPAAGSPTHPVVIWKHVCPARAAGPEADAWLSDLCGRECRLVYQHDDDIRAIDNKKGARPGDHANFADGYPLLLIGTASLAELNRRLSRPVDMARFRTNVVVDTDEPFVEDGWASISIGECRFDVAKRCARCVFTTIDPVTGEKAADGEPLKTLRGFRFDRDERGVMFGVNLIPRALGQLSVGQQLVVGSARRN